MSVKVFHISQLKPQFFAAREPKRNKFGKISVDFEYIDPSLGNSVYLLQTCKFRVPFGVNENPEINTYSLQLSIDKFHSATAEIDREFVSGIECIDERIKSIAFERSEKWFGKKMSREVIDELYKPSIKHSADWPPLMKIKLPHYDEKFRCEFYNHQREKGGIDMIEKGSNVICLLQLSKLWFMEKQFGAMWITRQVMIYPPIHHISMDINECLIQSDDESEALIVE